MPTSEEDFVTLQEVRGHEARSISYKERETMTGPAHRDCQHPAGYRTGHIEGHLRHQWSPAACHAERPERREDE